MRAGTINPKSRPSFLLVLMAGWNGKIFDLGLSLVGVDEAERQQEHEGQIDVGDRHKLPPLCVFSLLQRLQDD